VALAYNYASQPSYISPLQKIVKSNSLALLRDINFSLAPSRLNFSINLNRFYSENTLRNNDPNNPVFVPTTFNKMFNITRLYGVGWNLTKSLTVDFDASNLSVVDEPYGRLTGLKRDTVWDNIKRLGRTTNYNHTITLNYTLPFAKVPVLNWMQMVAQYKTYFTWQAPPRFAISNPALNVGNSIQNSRNIQLTPILNMTGLYNKFAVFRNLDKPDGAKGIGKALLNVVTSVKNLSGTYNRNESIFLPGYLPQSNFLGQDLDYSAPGFAFLLGSQADIRGKAIANNWLSTDTLQNQLYQTTLREDVRLRATIEPLRDLRIELTGFKTQDRSYQTNFKYLNSASGFQNLAPLTFGNYNISILSIATAFSTESGVDNVSAPYQQFLTNRRAISQRLGQRNPNSGSAGVNGYADGYGENSQDVIVPAFLAAYTGKDPSGASLTQFPAIPLPNWQITYNGLQRLPMLEDVFQSITLKHGYNSSFVVSNYSTLLQYRENSGGHVTSRDVSANFLPKYQFSQITIIEQFLPLLGADMRFKNNVTANFEYRQGRLMSLSLLNSQLTQQNEKVVIFGFGYKTNNFRLPFGLFNNAILKNDINFKIDFALRDMKTLIYLPEVRAAQVSSGAQNITYRPSIDYVISQRFNLNIFYDSNLTRPYTSQAFNTAFTNFGVNLKLLLQ
jgi:cell surface protein SprA